MIEKIILFGAGRRKERIINFIEKYGGFEILEIWDNNHHLIGKETVVNNIKVYNKLPYKLPEYNIVITTDIFYKDIERQLIEEVGISKDRIKKSNYMLKNFKEDILRRYKDSTDTDIIRICRYLQNHDLDMFNGQLKNDYERDMFHIYHDKRSGLLYSYWRGKKLYLSSAIQSEFAAKEYLCSLCKEQDVGSPHSYDIEVLNLCTDDIVIDGGAAEGFFALQIVDKVKKIYLVEGDMQWVEALKYTFEPYKHKVVIISKWLGNKTDEGMITLDEIGRIDRVTVVKLDIEGAESEAISGGNDLFSLNCPMKAIICTYHRTEDAEMFNEYFLRRGFCTRFSKGYVFVDGMEVIKPELRKGVLHVSKGREDR